MWQSHKRKEAPLAQVASSQMTPPILVQVQSNFDRGKSRQTRRDTYYPTTNGGMQNGSLVGIYTHCIHNFAQSVLINKISASELSWKFIKSELLVG